MPMINEKMFFSSDDGAGQEKADKNNEVKPGDFFTIDDAGNLEIDRPNKITRAEWKEEQQEFSEEEIEDCLRRAFETFDREDDGGDLPPEIAFSSRIFLRDIAAKKRLKEIRKSLSEDKLKLLNNIQIHSLGSEPEMIVDKFDFAGEMKDKNESRENPTDEVIYFGSADDLELAMLAGFSEVYLVDPSFDQENIIRFYERIKETYDQEIKMVNFFEFNFKYFGKEYIVHIVPMSLHRFGELNKKADAVMMYNKAPFMPAKEAKRYLNDSGIFLDNRETWED